MRISLSPTKYSLQNNLYQYHVNVCYTFHIVVLFVELPRHLTKLRRSTLWPCKFEASVATGRLLREYVLPYEHTLKLKGSTQGIDIEELLWYVVIGGVKFSSTMTHHVTFAEVTTASSLALSRKACVALQHSTLPFPIHYQPPRLWSNHNEILQQRRL